MLAIVDCKVNKVMTKLFRNRIGIFGSAFDPPHAGHLNVVVQALAQCDEVWLVPSARHSFGKQMAPWSTRVAMVEALAAGSGFSDRLRVETIEAELAAAMSEPIYAIRMLAALEARVPTGTELVLVMGPDNADPAVFHRWHRWQDLQDRYEIFVAESAGEMRSSRIRAALARGDALPPGWVPPAVLAVLEQTDWYTEKGFDHKIAG